jgi:hypothetical protein
MSGGAVDSCGNCGAPLDLDDDGRCRWCRAKARATRPHAQAFIISGNPDTVLLTSPGGTVMSMSLAQATAVRQPVGK